MRISLWFLLLMAAYGLLCCSRLSAEPGELVGLKAVGLEAEDPSGKQQTVNFASGRIVALGFTDRDSRLNLRKWFEEIGKIDTASELDKYVVVSFSKWIPFFIRGSIRSSFSTKGQIKYLLDWGQKASQWYVGTMEYPVIVLVAADGKIIFRANGRADSTKMAAFKYSLRIKETNK